MTCSEGKESVEIENGEMLDEANKGRALPPGTQDCGEDRHLTGGYVP